MLIFHGAARAARRRRNEAIPDTARPAHHLADRFLQVVEEETGGLLAGQNLVLLLDGPPPRLQPPGWLDPGRPLPGTLNHYGLRFPING